MRDNYDFLHKDQVSHGGGGGWGVGGLGHWVNVTNLTQ